MKRLDQTNINSTTHWDTVYSDYDFDWNETYKTLGKYVRSDARCLIDLGCGDGRCLVGLHEARPLLIIIGVDFSQVGINNSRDRYPWGVWECADVSETKLPDGVADYVLCSEVIEHLEDPASLFVEAYRLLEPGGRLLLSTPWKNRVPSAEHIWSFEYVDVEKMCKDAGFSEVWVFPYASGRCVVDENHAVLQPVGNWDEIICLGVK